VQQSIALLDHAAPANGANRDITASRHAQAARIWNRLGADFSIG
jgi:hypothetical protein